MKTQMGISRAIHENSYVKRLGLKKSFLFWEIPPTNQDFPNACSSILPITIHFQGFSKPFNQFRETRKSGLTRLSLRDMGHQINESTLRQLNNLAPCNSTSNNSSTTWIENLSRIVTLLKAIKQGLQMTQQPER